MLALCARRCWRAGGRPHAEMRERGPQRSASSSRSPGATTTSRRTSSRSRASTTPSFEILLGVADARRPRVRRRARVRSAPPRARRAGRDHRPGGGDNPKVAQLVGLEALASGRDLRGIRLERAGAPQVPLVARRTSSRTRTSAWSRASSRATGERTLGAALENLQICVSTTPGLIAVNSVSHRSLVVGKSMAVRPEDLARLGGFTSVGDVLAEDHVLGRRFLDAGFSSGRPSMSSRIGTRRARWPGRSSDTRGGRSYAARSRPMDSLSSR